MAMTIMVIAVKDDPPPRHDWVPREGGEASGDKFDGNFLENADSVHAEKNALI